MTEVNIDAGFPDLNDSDILKIEEVLDVLNSKQSVLLDDFPRECKERFYNAGFAVRVDMYSTNLDGVFMPEITIQARVEGEFDPDQMVWETTKDVLGIDETGGGVIKSSSKGLIIPGQ